MAAPNYNYEKRQRELAKKKKKEEKLKEREERKSSPDGDVVQDDDQKPDGSPRSLWRLWRKAASEGGFFCVFFYPGTKQKRWLQSRCWFLCDTSARLVLAREWVRSVSNLNFDLYPFENFL